MVQDNSEIDFFHLISSVIKLKSILFFFEIESKQNYK